MDDFGLCQSISPVSGSTAHCASFVDAEYIRLTERTYTERGDSGAELAFARRSSDSLLAGVGLAVSTGVDIGRIALHPEVRVRQTRDFLLGELRGKHILIGGDIIDTDEFDTSVSGLPDPATGEPKKMIGLEVHDCDTGTLLGILTAVDEYPASKVYTVKGDREILIPAVKDAFIRSVDLDAGRMDVKVWEGL